MNDVPNNQRIQETVSIEKYLGSRIDALSNQINERLIASEKDMDSRLTAIRTLMDERATGIFEQFKAAKDTIANTLADTDKAVSKAELANERRFDAVNEFRGSMTDMQTTFARRDQVETAISGLSKRLELIEQSLAGIGGSNLGSKTATDNTARMISIAVGVIAVAISLVAFFLRK